MKHCCPLGVSINDPKNVIYRTNNFSVTPPIGQMGIEGYLLLCSNAHYIGMGETPSEHDGELEEVLGKTKVIIKENYSKDTVLFEHGPRLGCHTGGGCIEHAHLHVVPTEVDILRILEETYEPSFEPEEINGFDSLREISRKADSSYLFLETQQRKRYLFRIDSLPSQYIRRIIAIQEGRENWNWREYPDTETFEKTIQRLQQKF